jgi:hypothetical protein
LREVLSPTVEKEEPDEGRIREKRDDGISIQIIRTTDSLKEQLTLILLQAADSFESGSRRGRTEDSWMKERTSSGESQRC